MKTITANDGAWFYFKDWGPHGMCATHAVDSDLRAVIKE